MDDYTKGRKVVIFGLPGAFTPTCSNKQLPGFVEKIDELRAKNVAAVACVSVNDFFVMGAWGKLQNAAGKVDMIADGSALFAKAMGLELDLTAHGMGLRSQRYALIAEDGVVKWLAVEPDTGLSVSSVESVLAQL